MPEISTAADPALGGKPTGQPHSTGWFWRLLGLHDRQSRPIASAIDDLETMDAQFLGAQRAAYDRLFTLGATRKRKYEIYDEMDSHGLVSAILDVYAEESTQKDYDQGVSVWVEAKKAQVKEALEQCLHNIQIEDRISAVARGTCKYGDDFRRLIYATGEGVLGWRAVRAADVTREEDKYSRLVGFRQEGMKFRSGKRGVSWPWDYAHFRLLGKDEHTGYGTSILDGMFHSWRRMLLTSESILMYRLRRMPDRNLIMVNVGNMEEHEAMAFVNQWRQRFRKHVLIDPASPDFRKQYNPMTPLEDIFVPLIEGRESRVETLAGGGNIGEIFDLEHFRDEFFGSAKSNKAYFGFEGDINAKATLIQQDVRWARTCKRVQRSVMYGLRQVGDIHLTLLQKDGSDDFDFRKPDNAYALQMSPISYLDEFERLELMRLRYEIVQAMSAIAADMQIDPRVWATYVLINFAKLPEDLVLKLIKKTPEEAPGAAIGGGGGFESQDDKTKAAIIDSANKMRHGFYPLSESEQVAVAQAVHTSPGLRKVIGDFASYFDDGGSDAIMEAGMRQTDPSLVPPILSNGDALTDDVVETTHAKELREDLEGLRTKTS